MAERGYMLSRQDARDFNRMRRDMRRQGPPKARRKPRRRSRGSGVGRLVDAELTASLSPASNSKTGASTASAKFLVPDPDNDGDLMDGDTFTVTNRSLDASGLNGDYIVVARIAGEWRPVWIDC